MLIVCPFCASTYSLTREQLGKGRTLRCAACRETWFATPSDDEAEFASRANREEVQPRDPMDVMVDDAPEPGDARAREPAASPSAARNPASRRPGRMARQVPGWLTGAGFAAAPTLALLAGLAWQSQAVATVLPKAAPLLQALGLPAHPHGIAFTQVRAEISRAGLTPALLVRGQIREVGGRTARLSQLQISLRDASGKILYEWVNDAPAADIEAGGSLPFTARLPSPPPGGSVVVVRFAGL